MPVDFQVIKKAFKRDYWYMGQNSKQINIAKYVSKFLIYRAKKLDKSVKSKKKKKLYIVLFCKVELSLFVLFCLSRHLPKGRKWVSH